MRTMSRKALWFPIAALLVSLMPATGAQAIPGCAVDAHPPFIRREGGWGPAFSNVVIVGEADAACPPTSPSGIIAMAVCMNGVYDGEEVEGGDSTCGEYLDTDGTVSGMAKVKCFAEVSYQTLATARGQWTPFVYYDVSHPPVSWGQGDCPIIPPQCPTCLMSTPAPDEEGVIAPDLSE